MGCVQVGTLYNRIGSSSDWTGMAGLTRDSIVRLVA